jgi:hypothetical protein
MRNVSRTEQGYQMWPSIRTSMLTLVLMGAFSCGVRGSPTPANAVVTEYFNRIQSGRSARHQVRRVGPPVRDVSSAANYGINATVRPVTPLACASVAPIRPARYALR